MTSAIGRSGRSVRPGRHTPRRSGFSILEVIIVLGIIALFTGFFLVRFDSGRAEELLLSVTTDLRSSALKSKKRSFTFRKNQYVIFSPRGFWTTENPPLETDRLLPPSGRNTEKFQIPQGVEMEILPPGATKWVKPGGYVWTFRSSGLSEPLKVRFSHGNSYSILSFNVLTGLAEEETILE